MRDRKSPLPPRVIGVLELLARARRRRRLASGADRQHLEGRLRHGHLARGSRERPAPGPRGRPAGAYLHSDAPPPRLPLRRAGVLRAAGGTSSRVAVERPGEVIVSPSIGGQLVPWSAAVICALIAAVAVWQLTQSAPACGEQRRRGLPSRHRLARSSTPGRRRWRSRPMVRQLAWSACDGSGCRLFVRPLDRLEAAPVTGTEDAHAPFFSPDGQWLGFFADGRVKKVALAGGAPVALADAPRILGGTWIGNDIIFAGSSSGGLMRVSSDGGGAAPLTSPRARRRSTSRVAGGRPRHAHRPLHDCFARV